MKGYKAMNADMTCRGFQYEIGKTYEIDGDISICSRGFHFCQDIVSVFNYYNRFESRVFEVEADGCIQTFRDKFCCQKIMILREVKGVELNRVIFGNGYGDGDGDGRGNGNGNGNGNGKRYSNSYGDSYGNGFGYGYGDGNNNSYGDIYGFGYGYGDGYGYGYGDSDGYGFGDGYGNGNGNGFGCGYNKNIQKILEFLEE